MSDAPRSGSVSELDGGTPVSGTAGPPGCAMADRPSGALGHDVDEPRAEATCVGLGAYSVTILSSWTDWQCRTN